MKKNTLIIVLAILILAGTYCIYNEIFNWAEFGELIKYLVFRLPIGLSLLIVSKYNKGLQYQYKNILSYFGFIIGAILLLPPGVLYALFIR